VVTAAFRKNDEIDDLLALSADVMSSGPVTTHALTAREAARALVGVVGWVSRQTDVLTMQEAMAALARHTPAWEHNFASFPIRHDGLVDRNVALIACVCSGLVRLFGARSLRSAVAFWATETDAAVWQTVAEA